MKLINKPRGTGKTTQLIYTSATTGFRIITPTAQMAKDMGLDIPKPLSDIEYRNDPYWNRSHDPILIDECPKIIEEALELYFNAPVVAAMMTVPTEDNCFTPTPKEEK